MSKVIQPGKGPELPSWAPSTGDAEKGTPSDYVEAICPFTSAAWGAMFPGEGSNPVSGKPMIIPLQANGTVYQRCHSKCALFLPAPATAGVVAKTEGCCALKAGALAAVEIANANKTKESVTA